MSFIYMVLLYQQPLGFPSLQGSPRDPLQLRRRSSRGSGRFLPSQRGLTISSPDKVPSQRGLATPPITAHPPPRLRDPSPVLAAGRRR